MTSGKKCNITVHLSCAEPEFDVYGSPRIDSKDSIPAAYVAWRAGTIILIFVVPACKAT